VKWNKMNKAEKKEWLEQAGINNIQVEKKEA